MMQQHAIRDGRAIKALLAEIRSMTTRERVVMDVCGGQTGKIIEYGLDELLKGSVRFKHGPGCPTCVTPISMIDKALFLAQQKEVILAAFGDVMRVPGTGGMSLARARAELNAEVLEVESPIAALELAERMPEKVIVYFAIGFETTTAPNALALHMAHEQHIDNFTMLVTQVTVPPALKLLLEMEDNNIEAFLAAGHVSTIMGYHEYIPIATKYRVPIVVTGFEPVDLLLGVRAAVRMLENGTYGVENAYARNVTKAGNVEAQTLMQRYFGVVDREWNGLGVIPRSGTGIYPEYRKFDAEVRFREILEGSFRTEIPESRHDPRCKIGMVHQGNDPSACCNEFGAGCTIAHPLGSGMFGEGVCRPFFLRHLTQLEES